MTPWQSLERYIVSITKSCQQIGDVRTVAESGDKMFCIGPLDMEIGLNLTTLAKELAKRMEEGK